MKHADQAVFDFQLKAGNIMEGGVKRLGALFLKFWAVPLIPVGFGLMLNGVIRQIDAGHLDDTFPVGVAMMIGGYILWMLARRLDSSAQLVRYRRQQNRIVKLARERGGRLTVTEAAAESGFTVEETSEILKKLVDGGFVEIEVTDSGMMVYRFPEVLYAHEKHWSRGIETA